MKSNTTQPHSGTASIRAFFLISLTLLFVKPCTAAWYSAGDFVATTAETGLMSGTDRICTLDPGTNFRVDEVRGNWVALREAVDGHERRGWVKTSDIMEIDREYRAFYATKDNLVRSQWQTIKLPRSTPVTVIYDSTASMDVFVISDEGVSALKWLSKNGSGQMSSMYRKLHTTGGQFDWSPSDDDQYFVLIDNTSFPDGGANAGRRIDYTLAYCQKDPKPESPRSGRGLLIGQATLDFDGYEGKSGRYRKSYEVVIKVFDDEDDSAAREVTVPVDRDGYFFLANADLNCKYNVVRIQSGSMKAPVTAYMSFPFRGKDEHDQRVRDAGYYALCVSSDGKIQTRITTPDSHVGTRENGSMFVAFSGNDSPLDRHDWFITKFPNSGWTDWVEKNRDKIYREREEAARKKAEKEREKAEKERQDRDAVPGPVAAK